MKDSKTILNAIYHYSDNYGIYSPNLLDKEIGSKDIKGEFYDYQIAKKNSNSVEIMSLDLTNKKDLDLARGVAYARRIRHCTQSKNFLGQDKGEKFDKEFAEKIIPVLEVIKGFVHASYYTKKLDIHAIGRAFENDVYIKKFVEYLFSQILNVKAVMEFCLKDENIQIGNIRLDATSPYGCILFDAKEYEIKKDNTKSI